MPWNSGWKWYNQGSGQSGWRSWRKDDAWTSPARKRSRGPTWTQLMDLQRKVDALQNDAGIKANEESAGDAAKATGGSPASPPPRSSVSVSATEATEANDRCADPPDVHCPRCACPTCSIAQPGGEVARAGADEGSQERGPLPAREGPAPGRAGEGRGVRGQ
eukprot:3740831-Alexandrium_andersonii.AAC.1